MFVDACGSADLVTWIQNYVIASYDNFLTTCRLKLFMIFLKLTKTFARILSRAVLKNKNLIENVLENFLKNKIFHVNVLENKNLGKLD